jgi:hypothetical protein
MDLSALASGVTNIRASVDFRIGRALSEVDSFETSSASAEQLYRLSSVRNDLHIAEFFEPILAEFNANP